MSDVVQQSGESGGRRTVSLAAAKCASVSDVARSALERRLRKVLKLLRRLPNPSGADPAAIHRLRVAIRRSEAALRTFRPLGPVERSRRLRKRLRRLRRLAGEIRDIDVFLERWSHEADLSLAAGEQAACLQRRQRLTDRLSRRAQREQQRGLKQAVRALVRHIRWRDNGAEPSIAEIAPELLEQIAQDCLSAADQDLRDVRRLHRFRIQIKRLRYACEFLETGLDPTACTALLTQLSELQQQLGLICDRATSVRILEKSAARVSGSEAAVGAANARLNAELTTFTNGWDRDGHMRFCCAVARCLA